MRATDDDTRRDDFFLAAMRSYMPRNGIFRSLPCSKNVANGVDFADTTPRLPLATLFIS